ncbi:hypothetical protein ABIE59_000309 [Marinobacter sp. MBR-99]|jgi:hypothetical protein|uniref:hypothetical protein n=1 Tax=Marinobacter sp. MBR-99 TaxID=3156461 RepID=UPI00339427AB
MMVNGLVVITQLGLVILMAMLALRMFSLSRQELLSQTGVMGNSAGLVRVSVSQDPIPERPAHPAAASAVVTSPDKTELFTRLHILAALQERDCRVNGLALAEAPEVVRTYAVAWLYGAACALSPRTSRHSEALAGMVARIANRKTGIRQPVAIQVIATLTSSGESLACYRAGLEGAEFWTVHQFVPQASSLYEVVTGNAFI